MKVSPSELSDSNEEISRTYPADLSTKDRIVGAIIGTLVGDALGVGCHWYYDLELLKQDFGFWISDYLDPKIDTTNAWVEVAKQRYKMGVRAGDVSQTGQLVIMLLESVAEKKAYDQEDFTEKIDRLFTTLSGGAFSGRYTDQAMRQTWRHRHNGISWDSPEVGSHSITSEAAQLGVILATINYKNPEEVAREVVRITKLFYNSLFTICQSAAYALNVAGFIRAVSLKEIKSFALSIPRATRVKYVPYFDSVSQIETGAAVAWNPDIKFSPPHLISQIYGAHCEIQQLLPAAYYLIHRYSDNFEMAVLSAINGGGNNMARAALTGGMSGAMNGLTGIPRRLVEGLNDHERLIGLAEIVAGLTVK